MNNTSIAKFEKISSEQREIKMPERATVSSAGYDIFTPIPLTLQPGESVVVETGLKCWIENGWVLTLVPRSGLGFKFKTRLANTIGVIDGDYYNNEKNEGHIMVKLCNEGDKELHIDQDNAFCQGIFLMYGTVEGDSVTTIRQGGLGSTTTQ